MLFQTKQFLIFFFLFYSLFLLIQYKVKARNILLLIASYYFYSYWDKRFILLLMAVTAMDFYLGLAIQNSPDRHKKKRMLWMSVIANLTILGVFKYYNFFLSSAQSGLAELGINVNLPLLKIALPVGVSFFTFESMSYIIDIYRGRIKAVDNLLEYAIFIAFFPHLVAGPIIRPANFFPMLRKHIPIESAAFWSGIFRFAIGIGKKVLIADPLASLGTDDVFSIPTMHSGWDLLLCAYGYTLQIYFDFSGYSDMAIGLSRMLGIELPENFETPYLSTSMQDFWRRWHISLSTWLRDYLYIPLGGSKKGIARKYISILLTMVLGGLWHGANWTFFIWGFFHGIFISLSHVLRDFFGSRASRKAMPAWIGWIVTFHLVVLGWIIFRSENFHIMAQYIHGLFNFNSNWFQLNLPKAYFIFLGLGFLVIGAQGFGAKMHLQNYFISSSLWLRITTVAIIIGVILIFDNQFKPFIYFQF